MKSELIQSEIQKNHQLVSNILEEGNKNAAVRAGNQTFQQRIHGKSEQEIRDELSKLVTSNQTRGQFDQYFNKLKEKLTAGEIQVILFQLSGSEKNALYYWLLFRCQQEMQKNKIDQDSKHSLSQIIKKLIEKIRQ